MTSTTLEATAAAAPRESSRLPWVDHLRVIACFAVVLIHVGGESYARFAANSGEWWLANFLNGSSRAAVPIS